MDDDQCAELARAGDVDALYDLSATDPYRAYTWLLYAEDLGFEDSAGSRMSDVEEHRDEFHYDEGYAVGVAHRELACAYLHALHGVPHDFRRGCEHLDAYLLATVGLIEDEAQVRADTIDELARGLDESLQAKLFAFAAHLPFRLVKYRVDRIERLYELKAPVNITQNEVKLLRESVDVVARLIDPSPSVE